VGVYPLVPKDGDRGAACRRLVTVAAEAPELTGLELPFAGALEVDEAAGLLGATRSAVLTTIPGVFTRLAADPAFGLASCDGAGRERALRFLRDADDAATRLDDALGRRAVRFILVHSSAAPGEASPSAFLRSLEELTSGGGLRHHLLLEHCDAPVAGRRAAKGFLALENELDAVGTLDPGAVGGVLINWGRSAIEGRGPAAVLRHIELARERGLLRGLMFSGCSASEDARGGAWADVHLPPSPVEVGSLLTARAAAQAVAAAGGPSALEVVGMKIAAPADADQRERERILRDSAAILLDALQR
jgi:hypothetical protein